MVQVHFKLDLEGLRDQKIYMDESLHGFLHNSKWIMFHGLPDIALSPSKRTGSNAKLGAMIINYVSVGS